MYKRTILCHIQVNLSSGFCFNGEKFFHVFFSFCSCWHISFRSRNFPSFCAAQNETEKMCLTDWCVVCLFATLKIAMYKCFYAFNIHIELNHMSAIHLPYFVIHNGIQCPCIGNSNIKQTLVLALSLSLSHITSESYSPMFKYSKEQNASVWTIFEMKICNVHEL